MLLLSNNLYDYQKWSKKKIFVDDHDRMTVCFDVVTIFFSLDLEKNSIGGGDVLIIFSKIVRADESKQRADLVVLPDSDDHQWLPKLPLS